MKYSFLCITILMCIQNCYATSSNAFPTEWRLDYASGDGVLVDADNKVLARYPLQKISNLRHVASDPNIVLGDIDYTQNNGAPLTLTFQSKLEMYTTSQQHDVLLHLKVFIQRCCFFAGKTYHLPPQILSVTPYSLIPNSTIYTNTNIDEASLSVTFMQTTSYTRPLDSSEYVHSRQLTVPIQRTLVRYIYEDDKKECYPLYHLSASHEGHELLYKEVTSTHPIAYTLINTVRLDQSSIQYVAPDRVAIILMEEWLRPQEEEPIQLSRRIELRIRMKKSYRHDDANLCSTKSIKSYVTYSSDTLMISETSEIIPYEKVVMPYIDDESTDLSETEFFNRPDGTLYKKPPIDLIDEDGFVVL